MLPCEPTEVDMGEETQEVTLGKWAH
jgi:hypothetical protein